MLNGPNKCAMTQRTITMDHNEFHSKYLFFFCYSRTTTKPETHSTQWKLLKWRKKKKNNRIRKEEKKTRSITHVLNVYKYVIQLLKPVGNTEGISCILFSFFSTLLYNNIVKPYNTDWFLWRSQNMWKGK